jgi:hypothetical protein
VFQSAWFAAVLGAAHDVPLWGTAAVLVALAWHIGVSARPRQEALLIFWVCVFGFGIETASAIAGNIVYTSGHPINWLPPYWMVALWGLLAIALNVTMRWLKHRAWLAALLGAIVGPISFVSGVRLGAGHFVDQTPALIWLAVTWAAAMPVLMWLSDRFDGVRVSPAA